MTGEMRAAAGWLIGVCTGAALLWFALHAIDARSALAIAMQADKLEVLGVVGCALVFAGLKALRWSWLVQHLRPIPATRLMGPVLAGIAVNFGIQHAGELVRAWMVARRESLPKAALLASIAVERLFDFGAVLLLGLIALLAGRAVLDILGAYLWVLLALIVATLLAVLPFMLRPASALGVMRALLKPLRSGARQWTLRHLEQGIEGLRSLQDASTLLKVLGLSVLQWALMTGCAWFSLRAVGVTPDPVMALVILMLLVVGLTLPAAPGHLGTTQVAFLFAAVPFGVGKEEAIAASFVYNFFLPVPLIAAGLGVLLRAWFRSKAQGVPSP